MRADLKLFILQKFIGQPSDVRNSDTQITFPELPGTLDWNIQVTGSRLEFVIKVLDAASSFVSGYMAATEHYTNGGKHD